ncbi:MAG: transposase, partial [Candidatus Saccharimonadales bacterium]
MDLVLPDSFWPFLLACQSCFGAPSFRNFCAIVTGWVHCLGRHTVTAVALASGGLNRRHISTFHRFFAQAHWALDGLGLVLFRLAEPWVPADQGLIVIVDDTLARKTGKCISLGSMHHDPLLSSARKPFTSFGHVWVVLALWVPLPLNPQRGFALPVLFRLYTGSKRGGQADAPSRPSTSKRLAAAQRVAAATPHQTKLELGRELIRLVASWAPTRQVLVLVDSAYAGRNPARTAAGQRARLQPPADGCCLVDDTASAAGRPKRSPTPARRAPADAVRLGERAAPLASPIAPPLRPAGHHSG